MGVLRGTWTALLAAPLSSVMVPRCCRAGGRVTALASNRASAQQQAVKSQLRLRNARACVGVMGPRLDEMRRAVAKSSCQIDCPNVGLEAGDVAFSAFGVALVGVAIVSLMAMNGLRD
jgi:hypothetical protein